MEAVPSLSATLPLNVQFAINPLLPDQRTAPAYVALLSETVQLFITPLDPDHTRAPP